MQTFIYHTTLLCAVLPAFLVEITVLMKNKFFRHEGLIFISYDIVKVGKGAGTQRPGERQTPQESDMAKRIDIRELISFDELLAAEDLRDFFDSTGDELKRADSLTQGVYFLLDDSRVLLLNSKKYLKPQ